MMLQADKGGINEDFTFVVLVSVLLLFAIYLKFNAKGKLCVSEQQKSP